MSRLRDEVSLIEDAAAGLRFAVVASRFHRQITEALAAGAAEALREYRATQVDVRWVPGAYELPQAAQRLAAGGRYDAIVCVGALVRGETAHFDVLAHATAAAIQEAARATGVPMAFGVLTCDDLEQARARAGGRYGNKGREAALAAIEMARLFAGDDDGRS